MENLRTITRYAVRVFYYTALLLLIFSAGFALRGYLDAPKADLPILQQARQILTQNGLKDLPSDAGLQ
jgi:hypothetical protein